MLTSCDTFPVQVWSVPEALITAELATAFPENGGYVVWVTAAFGEFWGFQVWRILLSASATWKMISVMLAKIPAGSILKCLLERYSFIGPHTSWSLPVSGYFSQTASPGFPSNHAEQGKDTGTGANYLMRGC